MILLALLFGVTSVARAIGTGNLPMNWRGPKPTHIDLISISPSGDMVAVAYQSRIVVGPRKEGASPNWDLGTQLHLVFLLQFSPDGKYLFSGSSDGMQFNWRLWDVGNRVLIRDFGIFKGEDLHWIAVFSPNGEILTLAGDYCDFDTSSASIAKVQKYFISSVNIQADQAILNEELDSPISALVYIDEKSEVMFAQKDRLVLYDVISGKSIDSLVVPGFSEITAMAVSHSYIAISGHPGNEIALLSLVDPKQELLRFSISMFPVLSMHFTQNGYGLLVNQAKEAYYRSSERIPRKEHETHFFELIPFTRRFVLAPRNIFQFSPSFAPATGELMFLENQNKGTSPKNYARIFTLPAKFNERERPLQIATSDAFRMVEKEGAVYWDNGLSTGVETQRYVLLENPVTFNEAKKQLGDKGYRLGNESETLKALQFLEVRWGRLATLSKFWFRVTTGSYWLSSEEERPETAMFLDHPFGQGGVNASLTGVSSLKFKAKEAKDNTLAIGVQDVP
jgi:hypothetical protein